MATTIRLIPQVQTALQNLSEATKRPMNKLVNEAVARYVEERSQAEAQELEALAVKLRAYRKFDPDDSKAIAAFAKAEASVGDKDDPAQGTILIRRKARGTKVRGGKIRALVHA